MFEVGSRKRNQPPPPHVIFEALTQPRRSVVRPWLELAEDEQEPTILEAESPHLVVWSSIWQQRPDAIIRFDIVGNGGGSDLRWTVNVDDPEPTQPMIGHIRYRMNYLVNGNLRSTFGQ